MTNEFLLRLGLFVHLLLPLAGFVFTLHIAMGTANNSSKIFQFVPFSFLFSKSVYKNRGSRHAVVLMPVFVIWFLYAFYLLAEYGK